MCHRMNSMPPAPKRRQRGLTLLESLVAIVVAALGILGIVGMQMRTLADTQTSVRRAQAIRLIEDLHERLKVNPSTLVALTSYTSDWAHEPAVATDCRATHCDPAELAAFDLADWKAAVKRSLPLGQATIFLAPGDVDVNRRLLGVMISWRENEVHDASAAYLDNIDATLVRSADGTLSLGAAGAATCPADRTCHLQYISAASRCLPDRSGGPGAAVQYYC